MKVSYTSQHTLLVLHFQNVVVLLKRYFVIVTNQRKIQRQFAVGTQHLLLLCVHYFLLFITHPSVALQDEPGILECLGIGTYRFVCFHTVYLYLVSATLLGLFLFVSVNVGFVSKCYMVFVMVLVSEVFGNKIPLK